MPFIIYFYVLIDLLTWFPFKKRRIKFLLMTSYFDDDVIEMINCIRKWTQTSCAVISITIKVLWNHLISISHFGSWQKCRKRDDALVSTEWRLCQSFSSPMKTLEPLHPYNPGLPWETSYLSKITNIMLAEFYPEIPMYMMLILRYFFSDPQVWDIRNLHVQFYFYAITQFGDILVEISQKVVNIIEYSRISVLFPF